MGYNKDNHGQSKHCLTETNRTLQSKRKSKRSIKILMENNKTNFKILIYSKNKKNIILIRRKLFQKNFFLINQDKLKLTSLQLLRKIH